MTGNGSLELAVEGVQRDTIVMSASARRSVVARASRVTKDFFPLSCELGAKLYSRQWNT